MDECGTSHGYMHQKTNVSTSSGGSSMTESTLRLLSFGRLFSMILYFPADSKKLYVMYCMNRLGWCGPAMEWKYSGKHRPGGQALRQAGGVSGPCSSVQFDVFG